jgi:hypothetical protein
MKVVRTVFNGGHEETYGYVTRLVPTQPAARRRIRRYVAGHRTGSGRAALCTSTGHGARVSGEPRGQTWPYRTVAATGPHLGATRAPSVALFAFCTGSLPLKWPVPPENLKLSNLTNTSSSLAACQREEVQSSTCKSGIWRKSSRFRDSRVASRARTIAAIFRSIVPIRRRLRRNLALITNGVSLFNIKSAN